MFIEVGWGDWGVTLFIRRNALTAPSPHLVQLQIQGGARHPLVKKIYPPLLQPKRKGTKNTIEGKNLKLVIYQLNV